jgi:hypothetical protein
VSDPIGLRRVRPKILLDVCRRVSPPPLARGVDCHNGVSNFILSELGIDHDEVAAGTLAFIRIRGRAVQQLFVGQETVIEAAAPPGSFLAIFEDDVRTDYVYPLDRSLDKRSIQDALPAYNVRNVIGRENPAVVQMGWPVDRKKVFF